MYRKLTPHINDMVCSTRPAWNTLYYASEHKVIRERVIALVIKDTVSADRKVSLFRSLQLETIPSCDIKSHRPIAVTLTTHKHTHKKEKK